METKKAILIKTDGYSIDCWFYENCEKAKEAMREQYNAYEPEELEEDWSDLSHCSDTDAILYNNGENVYVWRICEIPD